MIRWLFPPLERFSLEAPELQDLFFFLSCEKMALLLFNG